MRQSILALFVAVVVLGGLQAQDAQNAWTSVSINNIALPETATRYFEPLRYTAFTLNYDLLRAQLAKAPKEFTAAARSKKFVLSFPTADGIMERYAIAEISTMMPGIAAKRPEIRTYGGMSLDNPGKTIRFTISPYRGYEGLTLLTDKGIEYLEPLAEGHQQYYMAYNRLDIPKGLFPSLPTLNERPPYSPEQPEVKSPTSLPIDPSLNPDGPTALVGDVKIKVYRFACAATGEFTVLHGGKDPALAKLIATTNSLNAIYERDLNIRLKVIDEIESIVFTDPATDPYTGTTVPGWMNQNTVAMVNVLGTSSKYDVGHVFAVYVDGPAIGVAGGNTCTDFRGRGCSAWYGLPFGDGFFAIVGQEIGHQWNGGHTFNQCQSDSQFNYDSACEPGSGSTIMSYAGICGSNNVPTPGGETYLFYHACSIEEINRFVYEDVGNACGFFEDTDNNRPVVSISHPNNFFIPIRTPFQLHGSAYDPDGDSMDYSWDETDIGPTTPLGTPVGNSPLFKWVEPTTTPTRIFPQLSTILGNQSSKSEVLPTYERDLTFQLVARDNKANGGGLGVKELRFRSTTQAGPFLVTFPNETNTSFTVGEYKVITWDVANTNRAPVNCTHVNIKLSTDGGQNFTQTIAENVPNNGRFCMQVPNTPSNSCRIRIEAVGNVFFDLSNFNFKILAPTQASFSMCPTALDAPGCVPFSYVTEVFISSILGFSDPVTVSVSGVNAGAVAEVLNNPVTPGNFATVKITYPQNQTELIDTFTVKAAANSVEITRDVYLNVVRNFFADMEMESPANGENGVSASPILYWKAAPDADRYIVEVATSPTFQGSVVASAYNVVADSFKVPIFLEEGKVYYWRVAPSNACGDAPWLGPNAFVTRVENCTVLTAGDLPKNISANGTPTVESKITVLSGGLVSDVNVKKMTGSHTAFKDLEVSLVAPNGASALLFKNKCGTFNGAFDFGFDDAANTQLTCPPPTNGNSYRSVDPLQALTNQNSVGVWTLRVKDNATSSGGSLTSFQLELCSSVSLNGPAIVNNLPLLLPQPGSQGQIGPNLLQATDANTGAASLIYSLLAQSAGGNVTRNGVVLNIGDTFTQADIDNGLISYVDNGSSPWNKDFRVSVTDGEGGLAAAVFSVQLATLSTQDLASELDFLMSPNPATEQVLLQFVQTTNSDASIFLYDATGRLVQQVQLPSGARTHTLDVSALPAGAYAVVVQQATWRAAKMLLKK
jgi:subtilisin-like proprotein convertase family protein